MAYTISTLITALQAVQSADGDLPVVVSDGEEGQVAPDTLVIVAKAESSLGKAVYITQTYSDQ